MAKKKKNSRVRDYRHDEKRKNIPPIGMVSYEPKVAEPKMKRYAYDPHLSPQLVWAGKPGLKSIEVEDASGIEVETVSLHVHERVSAQAIIKAVQREDKQMELFADPQLPLHQAVQFYQHDVDWTNRLILGDSLLVANSLIEREMMAGKVQMIYMDPPYGVKYASNFQARIDRRDVKDGDEYLTREPEMIKAYRDTWKLGIHSYLTYMRDRLRVCKDLLNESGSIFVQISDENLHLVRAVMDEVFGPENFVALITFKKTLPLGSSGLAGISDYLLWYAKNRELLKYRQLHLKKPVGQDTGYTWVQSPDGCRRKMTREERREPDRLSSGWKVFFASALASSGYTPTCRFDFAFKGTLFKCGLKSWRTNLNGMRRLIEAERIIAPGDLPCYVTFHDDFPVQPLHNLWDDTHGSTDLIYVVQTSRKVVERCILMTTDPGDLVFDPTCGSGTTAYVAEQWGRRWITCDTSRVALALARQRLLTATYPYYKIDDEGNGQNPSYGFKYKTVPHITLKSIAQNTLIDTVAEKYNPLILDALKKLNKSAKTSFKEWEVPFNPDKKWSKKAKERFEEFRRLKQEKQDAVDKIIAEDAPQEILYDQPEVDRKIVRVSGPFTVEAIPPPVYEVETPIGGEPESIDSFDSTETQPTGENHIPTLISLLQKDGVTFPDNKKLNFDVLTARTGGVLHAEGEAENKRYAVSFGPLHGPVSLMQVEDGLREAYMGGYDEVIFCGFAFDPEAQAAISANPHPKIKAHASHIRPDVILKDAEGGDLLKTTASSQLFTVFGEPDIELVERDGEFTIKLLGVDVYDPVSGVVHSESAGRVAAWFVDTDYDKRTFCIVQAFFPNKKDWRKLERALKGILDEDRFDMLTGHASLPFRPGKHKRAAVKVIDQRGNEVMKVVGLE
ncbi:MAG: site-specific DNA-methyltransferase [Deltaproteobacteria bacterium]|nr:MAG: site-specific DNA-methyltransferase [Deltaproteobacteria bacterium]